MQENSVLSVWKQKLVAMANANESIMDGTMNPVLDILANNELVFAVWQDVQEENGVGILLLKGQSLLLKIMAGNQPMPARTSAIKCVEYEQALALKWKFGEKDRLH